MTAFRAAVLEHFRHPRNRGALVGATTFADGANPLCGDRIRIELRVADGAIAEARWMADACALCIASASVLTEHVSRMLIEEARSVDVAWINAALEGEPPAGRMKCAVLPLDTLRRALDAAGSAP